MKKTLCFVTISTCAMLALPLAVTAASSGTPQSGSEATITLTTPAWDSPLLPLDIDAYYLSITSEATAKYFFIERELYVRGEKAKPFSRIIGNGNFHSPQPLQLNLAVYLQDDATDPQKVKGTLVIESHWHEQRKDGGTDSSRSTSKANFYLKKQDLKTINRTHLAFDSKISTPGRAPLFYILYVGRDPADSIIIESGTTPEEVIERNPDATILFFYLRTADSKQPPAQAQ